MYHTVLLDLFEQAMRQRNPALADLLQPGLPEEHIREMLKAADIQGLVDPIVSLFAWKNGTVFGRGITLEQASPFPESVYVFVDLKTMIKHFTGFHEGFVYHPKFDEADERYFPLFWDNSTGYLAVDLHNAKHRLVLLDPESEDLAQEAYGSFEKFLEDAIRANEENDGLVCFQIQ
jgi:hypothetical protein